MDAERIQIAIARADLFISKYGKTIIIIAFIVVAFFIAMTLDGWWKE